MVISAIVADGALTKTGAGTLALTGANLYTGPTTVSAGTLLVNNTSGSGTGTGTVSVASGATLGGTGTIAGNTTVSGILSPGNAGIGTLHTGSLTWNGVADNKWIFDLGSTGNSDLLSITGDFLKGSGNVFMFDFSGSSTASGKWTLVEWTGTNPTGFITSDFSSSGLAGSFTLKANSLEFSTTAVPEPSTWISMAALVLGGGLLVMRRRARSEGAHASRVLS